MCMLEGRNFGKVLIHIADPSSNSFQAATSVLDDRLAEGTGKGATSDPALKSAPLPAVARSSRPPTWNGIELPLPLPLNAAPLDDEARGIDLDAIKARAAAGK